MRKEIAKSIWKLQSVSEKQSLGSASRRNSRAKERRNAQNVLIEILTKRHPDWLNGSVSCIKLSECEALLGELEQVKSCDAQYKYMHNFLCESLARGNKINVWDAQIPPPVQTFINERAHRAEADFHMIAAFRQIQQQFLTELESGILERIRQNPEQEKIANAPGQDREHYLTSQMTNRVISWT